MAKLESILHFFENTFRVSDFPDYSHALNGLQVQGPEEVSGLVAAVDASEVTIEAAVQAGADLLLVHHGLFWDGLGPISGPRYRKVKALIQGGVALYALHLPLDAHGEMGNCAVLTRAMGLEPEDTFAPYQGVDIGWWARLGDHREALRERLEAAVAGPARLIPGGPERVERVGILTGSGASALREASALGLDALITGEAAHNHFHDALELSLIHISEPTRPY